MEITNTTRNPINLRGGTLRDNDGKTYRFDNVRSGARATIRSRKPGPPPLTPTTHAARSTTGPARSAMGPKSSARAPARVIQGLRD
ncbi:hypothetical protein ACFQ7Z_30820 [Streptomyces virginiae]|uniref:hypothetical protein n=1 Tax=Streptomyces virginiae TaxID=1961 RepID=UPI0036D1DFE7